MLALIACSGNPDYLHNGAITSFKFKLKENSKLKYITTSTFFKDSTGKIRFADSNIITHRLLSVSDKNHSLLYRWELLPGASNKEVADTLFNEINNKGIYSWYNQELFEGSNEKILYAPFPLKEKQTWSSKFLSFDAQASCIDIDTILQTSAGQFHCFQLEYTFSPGYMYQDFIKDSINNEIKGVYSVFVSEEGMILSNIDYWIINKSNPKHKWKILSNTTRIKNILANPQ
jgi:hypothetical protein